MKSLNTKLFDYPENLIRDVFDVPYDAKLEMLENAAEIADKCLESFGELLSLSYIMKRRYKERKTIEEIAKEIDRDVVFVESRIDIVLSYAKYDENLKRLIENEIWRQYAE